MSTTRRTWIDNFGNDIESTKMYKGTDDQNAHRINLNITPINNENIISYSNRLRRASQINSDVQECHFNGTQKVFFCHKNPATCWACDLNTVQLFATRMIETMLIIPELKQIAQKIFWSQQSDGSFTWQIINN